MTGTYKELFEDSLPIQIQTWDTSTLAELPTCKGVLLFVDSLDQPLQLTVTANIRRLIANRIEQLTAQQPSKRSNIVQVASQIYYKKTINDYRTQLFYNKAARQCFPETCREWLDLPPLHLVMLDPESPCPSFRTCQALKTGQNFSRFGLFPTRKASDHYCHVLNTVFGLCRNPSIACTPKNETCNYYQMNQCDGYCMGRISKQAYLQRVDQACQCASNPLSQEPRHRLQEEMRRLGSIQEYEKAQQVKDRIELLKSLQSPAYHWSGELDQLSVFHADRSTRTKVEGKRKMQQTYDLFEISPNRILWTEHVLAGNLPQTLQKLATEPDHIFQITPDRIPEHLATLSRFIYRKNSSGLWLNQSPALNVSCQDKLDRINHTFSLSPQCAEKKDAED